MKHRLDPHTALLERCLKFVVDIMRIFPRRSYKPLDKADKLYKWVKDEAPDDFEVGDLL